MDKRLAKRHKRQVARAQAKVKISEPDVRTQEQIEAARQASRPDLSRTDAPKVSAARSFRGAKTAGTGSAAKTSV
jgi:hypothetical protein